MTYFFGGIKLDAKICGNEEGFSHQKCMKFGLVSYYMHFWWEI